MAAETYPIRSKRLERARRVQTAQHIFAAFLLITTAYGHLTDPKSHHVVLPLLEMAAGVALIATAIVEKVRKTHARVGWLELAGAAMTFIEAVAKLKEPHHLSFHILTFIPPVILLFFGLFDEQLRAGLRLEANDDHFLVKLRSIWWRRVRWEGLHAYRITPAHIELTNDAGETTRIRVTGIYDRDAAMAWAEEQFTKRGLVPALQTLPAASAC